MRIFTMRIIHRPRRKVNYYFRLERLEVKHLSRIFADNWRLISFYLYANKYEIYNERSNFLNKSNKTSL